MGRRGRIGLLAAVAATLGAAGAGAGVERLHLRVSQKDQSFRPSEMTIERGTTLDVVNDDGDLLHHAYVDSPTFNFDSGDQEPGTTVAITFNVAGTFNVLCGIHPRMKLKVRVE